jgi:rod shape-determining protein MreC
MKSSLFWRYRIALSSGALLLLSLHLLSTGVRLSGPLAAPATLLMEVLRLPQTATARMAQGASAMVRNYFALVGVRQENDRLRAELARIQTERARTAELDRENRRLAELLELRDVMGFKAVAADIIGSDATGLAHTLVLGRGERNGLKPGMAVLSNEGVVGKVITTSPNAARVLLIDDHNSAVDVFDQRSRARGMVFGNVEGGLSMIYVERKEDIRPGDPLVTDGLDGSFPRGLLIGHVTSVVREGPGLFLTVAAAPAVDFRRLEQVLVLTEQPPRLDDSGQSS